MAPKGNSQLATLFPSAQKTQHHYSFEIILH